MLPHGNFTVVNPDMVFLGKNVALNQGVYMTGFSGIYIGDNVVLSANVQLLDVGLLLEDVVLGKARKDHVGRPISIEDGVWVGAGATILPGVTVGRNSVIGAGSIVTRSVEPYTLYCGGRDRVIRSLHNS